jgi:hypothetical protein
LKKYPGERTKADAVGEDDDGVLLENAVDHPLPVPNAGVQNIMSERSPALLALRPFRTQ